MRVWLAVAAIAVVAALGVLYIGTSHRDECLRAGNVGCTFLPWSGHHGGNTGVSPLGPP